MPAEICKKCGKPGFRTRRWVRSTYYPMYSSAGCIRLEEAEFRISCDPNNVREKDSVVSLRGRIKGDHYRGHSNYHLIGQDKKEDKDYFDKQTAYRISSRRYFYDYVGHYSPEKFQEEMKDYKNGKRKSRPNGRIWHKVPVELDQRKSWWYSPDR